MKRFENFFVVTSLLVLSLMAVSEVRVAANKMEPTLNSSDFIEPFEVAVSAKGARRGGAKKVVYVKKGNMISIRANKNANWRLGPGPQRVCNADGCTAFPLFGKFRYGTLIGNILSPDGKTSSGWFMVGTEYVAEVGMTGWLYLACHDDVYDDNQNSITVKVNVMP